MELITSPFFVLSVVLGPTAAVFTYRLFIWASAMETVHRRLRGSIGDNRPTPVVFLRGMTARGFKYVAPAILNPTEWSFTGRIGRAYIWPDDSGGRAEANAVARLLGGGLELKATRTTPI